MRVCFPAAPVGPTAVFATLQLPRSPAPLPPHAAVGFVRPQARRGRVREDCAALHRSGAAGGGGNGNVLQFGRKSCASHCIEATALTKVTSGGLERGTTDLTWYMVHELSPLFVRHWMSWGGMRWRREVSRVTHVFACRPQTTSGCCLHLQRACTQRW